MWKVKQMRHDLVGKVVVAVGQQKHFGARLPNSGQYNRQTHVLLYVKVQILRKKLCIKIDFLKQIKLHLFITFVVSDLRSP